METAERRAKAHEFWDTTGDYFMYLYNRWQDEKDYEDFDDYKVAMTNKAAEHGVKLLGMKKRPFSFTWELGGVCYETRISRGMYKFVELSNAPQLN